MEDENLPGGTPQNRFPSPTQKKLAAFAGTLSAAVGGIELVRKMSWNDIVQDTLILVAILALGLIIAYITDAFEFFAKAVGKALSYWPLVAVGLGLVSAGYLGVVLVQNLPPWKSEASTSGNAIDAGANATEEIKVDKAVAPPVAPPSKPTPEPREPARIAVERATDAWRRRSYIGVSGPISIKQWEGGAGLEIPTVAQMNRIIGKWCGSYEPLIISASGSETLVQFPEDTIVHRRTFIKTAYDVDTYVMINDNGGFGTFELSRDGVTLTDRTNNFDAYNEWQRCTD